MLKVTVFKNSNKGRLIFDNTTIDRIRAYSNPRMNNKEMHNNSNNSLRGRKGMLMSATKIGKIISEQNQILIDQRERIRKIYDPKNLGTRSGSNNIRVTDEFPNISKNLETGVNSSFTSDKRNSGQRYNLGEKMSYTSNKTGEWSKQISKANLAYAETKNTDVEGTLK